MTLMARRPGIVAPRWALGFAGVLPQGSAPASAIRPRRRRPRAPHGRSAPGSGNRHRRADSHRGGAGPGQRTAPPRALQGGRRGHARGRFFSRSIRGPSLAALDQAQGTLARDQASWTSAQHDVARYQALASKEYVTQQQLDQARAAANALAGTMRADSAAIDQAKLNLQYATIRAPITGRAGSVLVKEGNQVRGGAAQTLVVINQISPILVRFPVPAAVFRQRAPSRHRSIARGPRHADRRFDCVSKTVRSSFSTTPSTRAPAPCSSRPTSPMPAAPSGLARSRRWRCSSMSSTMRWSSRRLRCRPASREASSGSSTRPGRRTS